MYKMVDFQKSDREIITVHLTSYTVYAFLLRRKIEACFLTNELADTMFYEGFSSVVSGGCIYLGVNWG